MVSWDRRSSLQVSHCFTAEWSRIQQSPRVTQKNRPHRFLLLLTKILESSPHLCSPGWLCGEAPAQKLIFNCWTNICGSKLVTPVLRDTGLFYRLPDTGDPRLISASAVRPHYHLNKHLMMKSTTPSFNKLPPGLPVLHWNKIKNDDPRLC